MILNELNVIKQLTINILKQVIQLNKNIEAEMKSRKEIKTMIFSNDQERLIVAEVLEELEKKIREEKIKEYDYSDTIYNNAIENCLNDVKEMIERIEL